MAVVDAQQALFANEVFCLAFTQKDADAMDSLWAQHAPLVCVHPGWRRLTARKEIMESWRRILSNPNQPGMDFYDPQAHAHPTLVLVTCYEQLPGGVCLATNGFIQEDNAVRMVLHHSGMCGNPPAT
ncbi:MAG: nuclear transport factor 2 family protein [Gammaproteobacteria bacterium]|nr:nuclear transport factor 2 family protein [Gammaproteobacteria bacterium]